LFDSPTVGELAAAIGKTERERTPETDLAQFLEELEAASDEEASRALKSRMGQVVE
jgi:hypothetical protein